MENKNKDFENKFNINNLLKDTAYYLSAEDNHTILNKNTEVIGYYFKQYDL